MKTPEEIFNRLPHLGRDGHYFHLSKTSVIRAMEEYAEYRNAVNLKIIEELEAKIKELQKGKLDTGNFINEY